MANDMTAGAAQKPFAEFLAGIDRGRVSDEITQQLAELVEAVTTYGRPGTLTLRVTVKPFKGGDGTVEVHAASDVKAPKAPHAGVFFYGPGYQLTRDDPSMEPMFDRADIENGTL